MFCNFRTNKNILVLVCLVFSINWIVYPSGKSKRTGEPSEEKKYSIQDTIYTFKSSYLEIDLSKQLAYVHFADKEPYIFKVSTGTPALSKGMKTQTGLFVIQSKATFCRSKQFNNVALLNWMGFNNGIGFHALQSTSYYKSLGVKPSSHGCVRVSKEDSKEVFKFVEKGTPVLVHNGIPGLVINFGIENALYEKPDYNSLKSIIRNRYNYLSDTSAAKTVLPKLMVDDENIKPDGIPIVSFEKVKSKSNELDNSKKNTQKKKKKVKVNSDSTKVKEDLTTFNK